MEWASIIVEKSDGRGKKIPKHAWENMTHHEKIGQTPHLYSLSIKRSDVIVNLLV